VERVQGAECADRLDGDRMSVSLAYNMDCMEALREMPDKAFDLAVDTSE
jgi:DNA modification methylase